jgi:NhaP-type Na+/H+ or K+/H+ antiporter
VLARARMSWEAHVFVSWFGPRGLNSLLLALLVVQAGVHDSELLLATVGVVVLASATIHGATAIPVTAWYERRTARETLAEERASTASALLTDDGEEIRRISPQELERLLRGPRPPLVLDVRSRSSHDRDSFQIPGSVRLLPDQVAVWAFGQPKDRLIVTYCT